MLPVFEQADVVLPAVENLLVLEKIAEYGKKTDTKVIFDKEIYDISCSKIKSNQIFKEEGLPMPESYPNCEYPVILKPDGQSGSSAVQKAESAEQVKQYLQRHSGERTVIQEYLTGRSYSLEVIGDGEKFYFPQITEVVVDAAYDCKRIIAPAQITQEEREQMLEIGGRLAKRLKIRGIFDIEVICSSGKLKLLEIDARLPSQTPISVYHSTGINMVELLVNLALGRKDIAQKTAAPSWERVCFYQQIQAEDKKITVLGEHIMGSCENLQIVTDFFGAQEAITDYQDGRQSWKAIVITVGKTHREAEERFMGVIQNIKQQMGCKDWNVIEG